MGTQTKNKELNHRKQPINRDRSNEHIKTHRAEEKEEEVLEMRSVGVSGQNERSGYSTAL